MRGIGGGWWATFTRPPPLDHTGPETSHGGEFGVDSASSKESLSVLNQKRKSICLGLKNIITSYFFWVENGLE